LKAEAPPGRRRTGLGGVSGGPAPDRRADRRHDNRRSAGAGDRPSLRSAPPAGAEGRRPAPTARVERARVLRGTAGFRDARGSGGIRTHTGGHRARHHVGRASPIAFRATMTSNTRSPTCVAPHGRAERPLLPPVSVARTGRRPVVPPGDEWRGAVVAGCRDSMEHHAAGSPGITVAVLDTGVALRSPGPAEHSGRRQPPAGYDMISDNGQGQTMAMAGMPMRRTPGIGSAPAEANDSRGPFYGCTELDPDTGSTWPRTAPGTVRRFPADRPRARQWHWHGEASAARAASCRCACLAMWWLRFTSLAGMRWAAASRLPGAPTQSHAGRIINLSLGGDGRARPPIGMPLVRSMPAGTLIVAAAGNSTGLAVGTPANCEGVLAVAALRHVGTKAGFSIWAGNRDQRARGNCANTDLGFRVSTRSSRR